MLVDFEKWHGNKNDFIIITAPITQKQDLEFALTKQAKNLCSRDGSGVSADGIIIIYDLHRDDKSEYELTIINSDGSLAATCGNGLRCAAAYAKKNMNYSLDLESIAFKLMNSEIALCRFIPSTSLIEINMGAAVLDADNPWFNEYKTRAQELLDQQGFSKLVKSIGGCAFANNHLCLFFDQLDPKIIEVIGSSLQENGSLDGINVHFIEALTPDQKMQKQIKQQIGEEIEDFYEAIPWERGAGLTQACGSGATAVAACALNMGEVFGNSWIAIKMPGGNLFIKKSDVDGHFKLAGPASFVFKGTLEL